MVFALCSALPPCFAYIVCYVCRQHFTVCHSAHTSLPNVFSVLQGFMSCWGLHANQTKLHALNVPLSEATYIFIQAKLQFQWCTLIPYLGINLATHTKPTNPPPNLKFLYLLDHLGLVSHLISWITCIHAVKMSFLPKLCLFHPMFFAPYTASHL